MLAAMLLPVMAPANITLRMQTDLGAFDIELFDTVAPGTVTNFLNYVNDGDYDGTFIHRSIPGFVVQGGGFKFDPADGNLLSGGADHIPTDPPIVNEFNLSNTRGTLTMAKVAGDPDSATSEWFFNVVDNSANLDTQNGGFTVFGQALGNGMEVIDAINALVRCIDVVPFPALCGSWPEVPGADLLQTLNNDNLILVNKIGADDDGDGAIDDLEDGAPNGGDGNNDSILDSTQQHVASVPSGSSGLYIVLESQPSNPLQSFNAMGVTFLLANPPSPADLFTEISFKQGYVGYKVLNVTPGGDTTVVLTLPAGEVPDTFYNYGPIPTNATPRWYQFNFIDDGETGAVFSDNTVTLKYVDGKRGDADLTANGVIVVSPGGAVRNPGDSDGISDLIEDGAPNNGDGNNDNVPDSDQDYVVSLPDLNGNYLILETSSQFKFTGVSFTPGESILTIPNPLGPPGNVIANPDIPPEFVTGVNFAHDFLGFELSNVPQGSAAVVKIILPVGEAPVRFLKFGPTANDPTDHFYEFTFDPATGTGAEFDGNVVILNFVDGGRGDSDLTANGVIMDPGAIVLPLTIESDSGGGGGCSLHGAVGSAWQAGCWWLLFGLLMGYRVRAWLHRRG
jgi:cyclophilin family peptidyl-prolyl cis-trans isomerase